MTQARSIFRFTMVSVLFGLMLAATGMTDDHEHAKRWLGREARHLASHLGRDDEGNETAGQMAAWLLVVANLPAAVSMLARWTTQSKPASDGMKQALVRFNRFQKRHLMRLHYLVNPLVLGIALWHWLSSRCRSTALPEWGLVLMVVLVALGLIVKFKLAPKALRRTVYRLHTHPLVFIAMLTVLTIGHQMVD